jgi:hypothetical protein
MKALDHHRQVEKYILAQSTSHREILRLLRRLIAETIPAAVEGIKWGYPWYWKNDNICYLAAQRNHVNLGFAQGANLPDPRGLLEGTGKAMRHIKVKSIADIQKVEIVRLLKSAARYDAKIC